MPDAPSESLFLGSLEPTHGVAMKRRSREVAPTREELELDNLKLKQENAELKAIHARDMEALKESSALLSKSKPPRPHMSSEKKLLIAGQQHFRCAGDPKRCPCWLLNNGSFDDSGFEVDHSPPWREAYRSDRAVLQALCHSCHALKTRLERIRDQDETSEEAPQET